MKNILSFLHFKILKCLIFYFTVNLGQKLLEALFEHWPRAHWFVENEGKLIKNEGKPLTNQDVFFEIKVRLLKIITNIKKMKVSL